jgi:hypothetical protein
VNANGFVTFYSVKESTTLSRAGRLVGRHRRTDGQTNVTKIIVTLRNFTNGPKKLHFSCKQYTYVIRIATEILNCNDGRNNAVSDCRH